MAIKHLFERDDVVFMSPRQGGAEFDDEGTGAGSGYGNTDDDPLNENDIDDEIHDDDSGIGRDFGDPDDDEPLEEDDIDDQLHDIPDEEDEFKDDVDDDSTLY